MVMEIAPLGLYDVPPIIMATSHKSRVAARSQFTENYGGGKKSTVT